MRGGNHMLAVLVQPHAEIRFVAHEAVIAGDHVRRDLFQRMADVRRPVWVVDRGGNVVAAHGSTKRTHPDRRCSIQARADYRME